MVQHEFVSSRNSTTELHVAVFLYFKMQSHTIAVRIHCQSSQPQSVPPGEDQNDQPLRCGLFGGYRTRLLTGMMHIMTGVIVCGCEILVITTSERETRHFFTEISLSDLIMLPVWIGLVSTSIIIFHID